MISLQPQMQQRQALSAKRVLVVDDEPVIRDICRRSLKGYDVVEAQDGMEALRLFEKGGIDVVLTDYMMPRMNGLELLARIKSSEPTFVVVMMTGFAEKDVILEALKGDADDFITKPLNIIQLKTAIDKALDRKALKEELANLRSLDRLKSNFLSQISHKFRTPITAISLFLQNLEKGLFDPEDEVSRENAHLVYEQSCYLGSLVTELLEFNKFMDFGGALNSGPCQLDEIIPALLAASREAAAKPGVRAVLELEPLPLLALDREKITFALQQVINNAFKFSLQSGQVKISLVRRDGEVELSVEDSGIGLSMEDMPKIFEKFYQVDHQKTGQIPGFGLGLYYAREFIMLHGGSIIVDSAPGLGSRFTITLPVIEVCSL